MKSLWERLAEMAEEEREKYLKTAPNKAKITVSGTKSAKYTQVLIIEPEGGFVWAGGPGWDEG